MGDAGVLADGARQQQNGRATDRRSPRNGGAGQPLRLTRRAALPNGRALIGGFLIALSAVGIFATWLQASGPPTTAYVVAVHDLALGSRIEPGDVRAVAMELPDSLARGRAFTDPASLVGATVIGPIGEGELVQVSSVARTEGQPGEHELSYAIASSRAVAGTLRSGEVVDVLATYGTGGDAVTSVVVRSARVIGRTASQGPLGDSQTETITLALAQGRDVLAVAHAIQAGQVTLVRTTGAPAPAEGLTSYSPPGAPAPDASSRGIPDDASDATDSDDTDR